MLLNIFFTSNPLPCLQQPLNILRQPASCEKIVSALQFNYMAHSLTLTHTFSLSSGPYPCFPLQVVSFFHLFLFLLTDLLPPSIYCSLVLPTVSLYG